MTFAHLILFGFGVLSLVLARRCCMAAIDAYAVRQRIGEVTDISTSTEGDN